MGFGAVIALVAGALALTGACESSGGGAACFPPEHGPSDPSCAAFSVGLSCPVDLAPWYTCVCTAAGSTQTWVCAPAGSGNGGSGSGGSGNGGSGNGGSGSGGGGSGGSTADASSE
jgi:hypothetical protein